MLPGKVMLCFLAFENTQDVVERAQNPATNSISKYIDVHHQFIRERVCQRATRDVQGFSEFQHADAFTKALAYDLNSYSGSVSGYYLPSAFVGQPVYTEDIEDSVF